MAHELNKIQTKRNKKCLTNTEWKINNFLSVNNMCDVGTYLNIVMRKSYGTISICKALARVAKPSRSVGTGTS